MNQTSQENNYQTTVTVTVSITICQQLSCKVTKKKKEDTRHKKIQQVKIIKAFCY